MAAQRQASRPARDSVARACIGFQRERLGEVQRARILSAMFDVVRERGAGNVSVAHVVERSGVSRRTFYEQFGDLEDCFVAAFELALSCACERVIPAYQAERAWHERVRSGLVALLSFIDEEPGLGTMLIVEPAAGPRTLARRREVIGELTSIVEQGVSERKTAFAPPPLTGEGIVGAVLTIIQGRLIQEPQATLPNPGMGELANPLMSMIVLPYLGAAAARRELERPVPTPRSECRSASLRSDPFKDAGIRLTYRTVRVLMAIHDHPAASNRLIAEAAEIRDQGQISKLLGRLKRAGMVTNSGLGPGTGAPNAWTLTASGRHVTKRIRSHTAAGRPAPPVSSREG